jgi:GT2 family glycosyltransferase
MQATLVISRLFDNTKPFARALAENIGLPVVLLKGDESLACGVRAMRTSRRVWFEGVGPFLHALVAAPHSWRLTKACLRVGFDEIPNLPLPGLWAVVSDLIVPNQTAARTVLSMDQKCRGAGADPPSPWRIHVLEADVRRHILGAAVVGEDLTRLVRIMSKPPGALCREAWKSVSLAADQCKGRVLLVGEPPEECREHLEQAYRLEVVPNSPEDTTTVDSIVFWHETPVDLDSPDARRCRMRLAPGGTVVFVTPASMNPHGLNIHNTTQDGEETLQVSGQTPLPRVDDEAPAAEDAADQPDAVPISVRTADPFVTVVIPVYNDAQRVGRAITSLRNQTWRDLEILVVDDGSTDDTARAVAKHLNDPRVQYLYKPHTGRPGTRNIGVREARGAYVGWLGSDDESLPNRIQKQVEAIQQNPAVDIVHTDGFIFRPDGSMHDLRRYQSFTAEEFPRLLMAGFSNVCPILDTTAVIRRELYQRLGLYDTAFLRCQDYDFYIRTAMAGDVVYCHVPLALVKVHTNASSDERRRLATEFYTRLALRMIEFFGPERLMDAAARDLHLSPDLVLAEYLVPVVEILDLGPGSALYEETLKHLERASRSRSPEDRREAFRLLSVVAHVGGDKSLAEHYLEESRNAVAASAV